MSTKIKMLSLWQPWASLCVWTNPDGGKAEKQIETRHWQTPYRGLVAIHATKTLVREAKLEIETNSELRKALLRHGFAAYGELIRGSFLHSKILGVVELTEIRPLDFHNKWLTEEFSEREEHFGFYQPGRFGWVFKNHVEFDNPIPCRGLQSLGAPKPEIQEQILSLL